MELGHTKTWQEVLDYYGTDIDKGLSEEQVRKNQEKYGPNGQSWNQFFINSILRNQMPFQ